MPDEVTKVDTLMELARQGPFRSRDLTLKGIPRSYLQRLCERGILEQVNRGLYRLVESPVTEFHTLAEASKCVPNGIVCLLSALQFHGLTTELPHGVWLLIDRHARKPTFSYPPTQIIRASGNALSYGVEIHPIESVRVKITHPAKTVADCFRFRRHVGMEAAMAALRDYLRKYRGGVDDLMQAAKADRIYAFIRPYVEALI